MINVTHSVLKRLAGIAIVVACVGCGSATPSGGDDDVVSLGDGKTSTPDGTDEPTPDSIDPADAFNAYTECMRDEGIDMPDAQVISAGSASGGAGMQIDDSDEGDGQDDGQDVGPNVDFESAEFKAAEEVCRPILDDTMGEIEIDPEVLAEQRENMLDFAKCMRGEGIDFPDPQFDENGGVSIALGGPDGGDEGGPDQQDFESEEWEAASKKCGEFLGDGFVVSTGDAEGRG